MLSPYATERAGTDAERAEWATLVERITAHELKNGWWVADDKSELPGQVSDLKMSKTGKHGHAKFTYKLNIPFSGKTANPMHPGGDSVFRVTMSKNEWDVIDCADAEDGKPAQVEVQPDGSDSFFLNVEPELYEKIKAEFSAGEKLIVILVQSGPWPKGAGSDVQMVDMVTGYKTE